jgi:hypothetical protein
MSTYSKQHHGGHSIAYFLWIYAAIFTTIMLIVMIEEGFFLR